jgi:hypothetical protein
VRVSVALQKPDFVLRQAQDARSSFFVAGENVFLTFRLIISNTIRLRYEHIQR